VFIILELREKIGIPDGILEFKKVWWAGYNRGEGEEGSMSDRLDWHAYLGARMESVLSWSILWRFDGADSPDIRWYRSGEFLVGVENGMVHQLLWVVYRPEGNDCRGVVLSWSQLGGGLFEEVVGAVLEPRNLPLLIGTGMSRVVEGYCRDHSVREAA